MCHLLEWLLINGVVTVLALVALLSIMPIAIFSQASIILRTHAFVVELAFGALATVLANNGMPIEVSPRIVSCSVNSWRICVFELRTKDGRSAVDMQSFRKCR